VCCTVLEMLIVNCGAAFVHFISTAALHVIQCRMQTGLQYLYNTKKGEEYTS
jgi:hypothetical protein